MSVSGSATFPSRSRRTVIAVCIFLFLIVWAVFGQTLHYPFVSYDDERYVAENPEVTPGLTVHGLAWAFGLPHRDYWHPLDFVSHMLDCQIFGLNAGGHHFSNVLFHGITAVLLFLVFCKMTGAVGRSAFIATVFAIHPLHVESVAWITERKDVLSGLFFVLTIWVYVAYVERPFSLLRYLIVIVCFVAGLMAKPTIMSLPLVLLLLDYWPLREFRSNQTGSRLAVFGRLLLEKLPLFVLAGATCLLAARGNATAFESSKNLSRALQLENAVVSGATYVWQTVYPRWLAVLYPFPEKGVSAWLVISASLLIASISVLTFLFRRGHEYLFVGWFWYLVMVLPTIGIIQAGGFAHADRYCYLPQIGLVVAFTWGIYDLTGSWPRQELILGTGTLLATLMLGWLAWKQVHYWRDTDALWQRTLSVTSNNYFAEEAYAEVLLKRGEFEQAIEHYQAGAKIRPTSSGYRGLGFAFAKRGDMEQAVQYLRAALQQQALQHHPNEPEAHTELAAALFRNDQVAEAITEWNKALETKPNDATIHASLAAAYERTGETEKRFFHWEKSLQLEPNADSFNSLGIAISQTGQIDEAIKQWKNALAVDPDNLSALCNLAWVLSTSSDDRIRNGTEAFTFAQHAVKNSAGKDARVLRLLAAALAEKGQFEDAAETAEKAAALAENQGNSAMAKTLRENASLFRTNRPLRDAPGASP